MAVARRFAALRAVHSGDLGMDLDDAADGRVRRGERGAIQPSATPAEGLLSERRRPGVLATYRPQVDPPTDRPPGRAMGLRPPGSGLGVTRQICPPARLRPRGPQKPVRVTHLPYAVRAQRDRARVTGDYLD